MAKSPWFSRVVPFGLYMLCIALHGLIEPMVSEEVAATYLTPGLYTVKTVIVLLFLIFFWKSYDELSLKGLSLSSFFMALFVGVIVFILWINMDWPMATMGDTHSFDPNILPTEWLHPFFAIRLFGAAIVVPIFEELFWRSFILRYIVDANFTSVKLGTFTWPSFVISSILFGLEHNLWLAGIIAAIFYNLLLYRTKNLWACIIAHGITNLILGIYVIKTGSWAFW